MIGGSSNRLYNILASGGFAFVRYFDKIEEMFINHKHLVWYNSIEEIPDLLNLYLNNTNKIDEIKLNALNIFNSAHSAEHRLHNIFSIMDGTCNDFLGKICP
jgi:spore maturation protein CgeB